MNSGSDRAASVARSTTPMSNTRAPWGYVLGHDNKLTAITSQSEIRRRSLLGETAIRLLGALGITPAQLETMLEIEDPQELLAKLTELTT